MTSSLPNFANGPPAHLLCGLLDWESEADFRALFQSHMQTWCPAGPAEISLTEQLVWIEWRRRRLRIGERALHMSALDRATSRERHDALTRRALAVLGGTRPELSSAGAIQSDASADSASRAVWSDLVAAAQSAEAVLEEGRKDAFELALASLPDDTREWFIEESGDESRFSRDAEGLMSFLHARVFPYFESHLAAAEGGPTVRLQAWGESLDPFRMEKLLALDERLSRQFEKSVGMLVKLQSLRFEARAKTPNPALVAG